MGCFVEFLGDWKSAFFYFIKAVSACREMDIQNILGEIDTKLKAISF